MSDKSIEYSIAILFLLLGFASRMLYDQYEVYINRPQGLCPHGHEDWDDCPVCGH